jgi:hypothetical protein
MDETWKEVCRFAFSQTRRGKGPGRRSGAGARARLAETGTDERRGTRAFTARTLLLASVSPRVDWVAAWPPGLLGLVVSARAVALCSSWRLPSKSPGGTARVELGLWAGEEAPVAPPSSGSGVELKAHLEADASVSKDWRRSTTAAVCPDGEGALAPPALPPALRVRGEGPPSPRWEAIRHALGSGYVKSGIPSLAKERERKTPLHRTARQALFTFG